MEIPKSLQSTWNEVSKDNKITKQEYEKLLNAAAPNKKNDEFDNEEVEFLSKVKDSVDAKGFVAGNVPDEFKSETAVPAGKTPASTSKEQSFEFIGNVGNASDAWSKKHPGKPFPKSQMYYITKDGNLVSQAKVNETAKKDPNYFSKLNLKGASAVFVPNLKASEADNYKLQNNKIVSKTQDTEEVKDPSKPVSFVEDEEQKTPETDKKESTEKTKDGSETSTENKTDKDKTNDANKLPAVPETLKAKWDEVSKDGQIDVKDYKSLLQAATPNNKSSELTRDEVKFLMAVKKNVSDGKGVYKLNDKAPVDTDTSKVKPEKFNPGEVPDTLKETWKKISADGSISKADYSELIKATAPTGKDDEIDEKEAAFLSKLKEKFGDKESVEVEVPKKAEENKPQPQPQPEPQKVKIPSTLQSIWEQLTKDKDVTVDDLNALIKAAMPTGKDEEMDAEERKFITDLTNKMIQGNGVLKM